VWQQCVFINADIELGNTTKWWINDLSNIDCGIL
jgi:hypothetical protein